MKEEKQIAGKQNEKFNFFELATEIFGWLQIFASPFLIALAVGFIIYLSMPGKLGIIIAILVAVLGLIIGIIWATKTWKKKGTVNFMSRVSATPELDNEGENE